MYLDICYTVSGRNSNGSRRFIDPKTVEILFLNEVVDNPSNTLTKCMSIFTFCFSVLDNHHLVPLLGLLPAAFSSRGSILNADEIVSTLIEEHSLHSEHEDYLLQAFPRGSDILLSSLVGEVIDHLLYENERVFQSYTAPLIRSVYWPNFGFGYWQSWSLRETKLAQARLSSVHSASTCIKRLEEVVSLLTHAVDVTESMKLPLRISSKLFSLVSVLLTIPLEKDPELSPLADFLSASPQFATLAKWCERTNDGCKVWPARSLSTGRKSVEKPKPNRPWWEWFGWSAKSASTPSTEETPKFVPVKSHNILFAMASVGALFFFLSTPSRSSH